MHRVLFEISGFSIYSYGLMLSIALLLATVLLCRQALREGISYDHALEMVIVLILGGVIGARVLYILLEWDLYAGQWDRIFNFRHGGLSIYGGFLGGAAALILWCFRRRVSFAKMADLISPYLILGYAFGRIGCFLNGCCFGKVSAHLFSISLPAVDSFSRHPVQLYSTAGSLVIFAVLLNLRRFKPYNGFLLVKLTLLYGLMRFTVEFFREGETWAGPFTMAQGFSLGLVVVSAFLSVYFINKFSTSKRGLHERRR